MKLFVGYEADVLKGTAMWNVSVPCWIYECYSVFNWNITFLFLPFLIGLFMFSIWTLLGFPPLKRYDMIWLVKVWRHHDNFGDYLN